MTFSLSYKPVLRWPLDINNIQVEGQSAVVLRDPLGIAEQTAIIPQPFLPIIVRFDGSHSIQDILNEGQDYGVTEVLLRQIIDQLDSFDLLDNERTQLKLSKLQSEFHAAPHRTLACADLVYPRNTYKLKSDLQGYMDKTELKVNGWAPGSVVAVISPHIDYRRGWQTYGQVLHALSRIPSPDVVILVGTAHQPSQHCFTLTKKSFLTPFGTMYAAEEFINSLASEYGPECAYTSELLHRKEHSLELQLPLLGFSFAKTKSPQVIPILVGSFHSYVEAGLDPFEDSEPFRFSRGLGQVLRKLKEENKRVLVMCGVDLAHMGQNFGDNYQVSPEELPKIEAQDKILIEHVCAGDSAGLLQHIINDQDRRRICGFPTLLTVLKAFESAGQTIKGSCLEYRQAVDESSDCVVSFFAGVLNEV